MIDQHVNIILVEFSFFLLYMFILSALCKVAHKRMWKENKVYSFTLKLTSLDVKVIKYNNVPGLLHQQVLYVHTNFGENKTSNV